MDNKQILKQEKQLTNHWFVSCLYMVGKIGIEPIRVLPRRILSPVRLPVPPLSHARNILTFFLNKVNKKLKKL